MTVGATPRSRMRVHRHAATAALALIMATVVEACAGPVATVSPTRSASAQATPSPKVSPSPSASCVSFPGEVIARVNWTADGKALLVSAAVPPKSGRPFVETVRVLSLPDFGETKVVSESVNYVYLAAASANGPVYSSAKRGDVIGLWILSPGEQPKLLRDTGQFSEVFWTPNGIVEPMLSASNITDVSIWLTDWQGQAHLLRSAHNVFSEAVSTDGSIIGLERWVNRIQEIDVWQGDQETVVPGVGDMALAAITPDGKSVIQGSAGPVESGLAQFAEIPIAGGPAKYLSMPVQIPDGTPLFFSVSPQGHVAYMEGDVTIPRTQLCVGQLDL